ncbi:MAG TPA: alkaline phosphatase family protein [Phycisphaerae bacterium]|nr:alkaline phosphatase family protein [Phycisphaerae bacterium]
MATGNRVLIIGLDGMGPEALAALTARGAMPTLAAMARRGASGVLASTVPPVTCPAWPTMCTGVGPGRHGLFSFVHRTADGRARVASASDLTAPRFWQLAAAAGRRTAVLYVPAMFPADAVEPLAVSGYPAPEREGAGAVYPPEAEGPLRRAIPRFQPTPFLAADPRGDESPTDAARRAIREAAEADAHRITTAFDFAAARAPLDLAMAVFSFPDHLFHAYYNAVVAPDDAPDETLAIRSAVDEAFARLDAAIERLIEHFGQPATVLVVSDHGFAAKRGSVHVAECLRQAGLLKPAGLAYLMKRLVRRRRTRDVQQSLLADDPWTDPSIDWSRTQAFAGYDHEQAVFVNLEGRCPRGTVPAAEYDAVIERAVAALLEVRDPETGDRPVRAVRRRNELYTGPHVDRAPDLLVELADGWQVRRKLAWRMRGQPPVNTHVGPGGVHHPDGILLADGQGVRPGAQPHDAQLADIAATVLALAGLASADPLDGRTLDEVFALPEERQTIGAEGAAAEVTGYTAADEDEVARRLEDLGYL